jgi:predicted metal-dependent peptidase
MSYLTPEERVKKCHITLMRHVETAWYSSIMMMGESEVTDSPDCPTAYTDGFNKAYGLEFISKLNDSELRGLILHENLHVQLLHIMRHKDLIKENPLLANIAMDFVVNDIIMSLKDKQLASLPDGGVYDPMFHGWSVREIYNHLRKENPNCDPQKGSDGRGGVSVNGKMKQPQGDIHDVNGKADGGQEVDQAKAAEIGRALEDGVRKAIYEGAMLAGRLGANIPRQVEDSLERPLNWREVMREFVSSSVRGREEYTWRHFNRALIVNNILAPSVEDETVHELIFSFDTSGSISQSMINSIAFQLQVIADTVRPDILRVLWWDTEVHGEQVFEGTTSGIAGLLKPMGGGGTRASCVSEYISNKRYNPDCVVVFTDGYVESNVSWNINAPTLWLVTDNKRWNPPKGKKVFVEGV